MKRRRAVIALLYEFIPGRVAGRYNNIVNFYYHDTHRVVSDFAHLATSDTREHTAGLSGAPERKRETLRNESYRRRREPSHRKRDVFYGP